ncbi:hypothetical protein NDU88_003141 [Pleurodeles waltl]|uniref:Uncharacterized protein n=1 Tax=Pleurodeles waltl TaxID=8319 RepID=A0AAV7T4P3_PLEWA|nr:hypothetical protein NDU88_003141 [Pleurodeles waltl]
MRPALWDQVPQYAPGAWFVGAAVSAARDTGRCNAGKIKTPLTKHTSRAAGPRASVYAPPEFALSVQQSLPQAILGGVVQAKSKLSR